MKQTLIFEPDKNGHRQEFIEHLMAYLNEHQALKARFVFLLNADLVSGIHLPMMDILIETLPDNTTINEHKQFIINVLDKNKNIDTVLFMNIDPYLSTLISLAFNKPCVKIKGILFQPFHQFPRQRFDVKSLRFRKKNHLLAALLINRKIEKIFVLNDENGSHDLNKWAFKYIWKKIFQHLPDPIDCRHKISSIDKEDLLETYKIEKNRSIFLAFGAIDARKNIIKTIKALSDLEKEEQKKVCLLIVGKNSLSDKEELPELIAETKKNHPNLQIILKSAFVDDDERERLFLLSDVVVMAYINFFASSGVLGHAIKYQKPVIGSDKGLTSTLIRKYDLGILVDTADISPITEGVQQMLEMLSNGILNKQAQVFLDEYTPELFARVLLEDNFQ